MGAIEELDAAILLAAVLPIKLQEIIANLLDSAERGKRILAPVDTEMRARNDQLVDRRGIEFLQQRWNIIKSAVTIEIVRSDE